MNLDTVERLADAILYEGYLLYPYRASALKNQLRWQFGIVAPESPRADGEPWFSQTECVVEAETASTLHVRARFLRPHRSSADGPLSATPCTIDAPPVDLSIGAIAVDRTFDADEAAVRLQIESTPDDGLMRVRVRLENLTLWCDEYEADRSALLCASLVSTHLVLRLDGGEFISLLEPLAKAEAAAARCKNINVWPVLAGDRPSRKVMLSSPLILYDYPSIAAQSPGNLCDGTEIDEILSLRILTLTDDEKREARETDVRAQGIVDGVDRLAPEDWMSLHGAMRDADFFNPPDATSPEEATVTIAGATIGKGAHVRLRPSRRADAMDMFLRDQPAIVAGIYRDLEDRVHVAVTVDCDPAAALHESFGRFFYFDPSEIEPVEQEREDS